MREHELKGRSDGWGIFGNGQDKPVWHCGETVCTKERYRRSLAMDKGVGRRGNKESGDSETVTGAERLSEGLGES